MSPLKKFLAAFALAAGLLSAAAPVAAAQGTKIITIDEARILAESKAAKDIDAKLKTIEQQINAELEPTRAALNAKSQALKPKLEGKTPEAISADAQLVGELQVYQADMNAFGNLRKMKLQEFQLTERKALVDFNKALEPVLLEVLQEKGADMILSRSVPIYSVDAVDVSADVIAKLDVATPTLQVVRQKLPAQTAQ